MSLSKGNKLSFYRKETASFLELKEMNKTRRFKKESDTKDEDDSNAFGNRLSLKYVNNFNKKHDKEETKNVIMRLHGKKKSVDMGTRFINEIYDLDNKSKR